MSEQTPLAHHSMYRITARLVTYLHESVTESFGDEAKTLIRKGTESFGLARAKSIAERARREGEEHILFDYVSESEQPTTEKLDDQVIYPWMATWFAQIAKQVVDQFGEQGKDAIREGVRRFGLQRGENIANRAEHLGYDNTIEHYLSNYDMGRSDLFEFDTTIHAENIDQTFTKCPFGQQWADENMHEYGILYCEMIDPSIAKGYNKDFEVDHPKFILKEGVCQFDFKLKRKTQ
ncbi:hypothetical protein DH09_12225 [Bacillaceae bacterium JMAK1]|nr:hypothetical protein DH09_12225 [Bacillaceae bacterium JMAK1]